MSEVRWSLITVTYNSSATLSEFWRELKLPVGIEWIVVDNASTDDSTAVAERLGARVIALPSNVGFSAANNIGLTASRARYVAFLNPDVRANTADLALFESILTSSPKALVAPQLLNSDGTEQPNGRGKPYLSHKVIHRLRPSGLEGKYRRYANQGEVISVEWAIGAAVAGTRARIDEIGGWDDYFFLYYEDSDICLRNSQAGGETLLVGTVRWVHGWARETAGFSLKPWLREIPSMVKFYRRYPELILSIK